MFFEKYFLYQWKLLFFVLVFILSKTAMSTVFEYTGMCDASASLAVDEKHFIIANDEDNILRIYHIDQKSPVAVKDLSSFLKIERDDKSPESDIEGAAKIGDYYFFITSHGRDRKGRLRPNRHQFFAVEVNPQSYDIVPVGHSYQKLMDDLVHITELKKLKLADAYQPDNKKAEELAPKERGVNIEGLAATPDGSLLIGFRNPIPGGKAIVAELLNPIDVLNSKIPKFGMTSLLDMAGRGIRSIENCPESNNYVIVAGARDDEIESGLYIWDRTSEPRRLENIDFSAYKKFNPEALHFTRSNQLQISSDDGTVQAIDVTGKDCECKELSDQNKKHFRSLWIDRNELGPNN